MQAMRHLFKSCEQVEFDFGEADRCFDVIRAMNFIDRFRDIYDKDPSALGANVRANYETGARMTLADATYHRAWYGITAADSAASGLAQFRPDGGVEVRLAHRCSAQAARRVGRAAVVGAVRCPAGDGRRSRRVSGWGRVRRAVDPALKHRAEDGKDPEAP